MKKIIVLLILTIFLIGCKELIYEETAEEKEQQEITNTPTEQEIAQTPVAEETYEKPYIKMTLSTDKELYHSNELMKINVSLISDKDVPEAQLRVYGIYSSRNRLDQTQNTNINFGDNELYVEYTTPRCNTCSGIRAGTYQINAELIYNGNSIAKDTKSIEIRQ